MVELCCEGDLDYYEGVASLWESPETLILVEHDMEYSDDLVDGLLACPEPACTYAYTLYWASTHQAPHYAQRDGTLTAGRWLSKGERQAMFSGIGFCKITPGARTGPLEREHWALLDIKVNAAVRRPWHVHREIEHYHR